MAVAGPRDPEEERPQDFYDRQYRAYGVEVVEWLRVGAREKARSIEYCLEGTPIREILEIGCGTGAILERLDQAGFGERYWAVDFSEEAVAFVRTLGIRRLQRVEVCDGNSATKLFGKKFDLVVLSHVLEHVAEPEGLLRAALSAAHYVFVEVPLESSVGLNLKAAVLEFMGRSHRSDAAGHLHYYSQRSFLDFLRRCGAQVLKSRLYVPMDPKQLAMNKKGPLKRLVLRVLYRTLGTAAYSRLWYGHLAVLVSGADGGAVS